ncbi:hypothetical protein NT6N_16320 [Oceaniferula spumae]|uniref:Uncharacterized protein n=1 Tax=Oceaniferula spumae TaxID=2979115 RepID=A0AAT9FKG4_9BACT
MIREISKISGQKSKTQTTKKTFPLDTGSNSCNFPVPLRWKRGGHNQN